MVHQTTTCLISSSDCHCTTLYIRNFEDNPKNVCIVEIFTYFINSYSVLKFLENFRNSGCFPEKLNEFQKFLIDFRWLCRKQIQSANLKSRTYTQRRLVKLINVSQHWRCTRLSTDPPKGITLIKEFAVHPPFPDVKSLIEMKEGTRIATLTKYKTSTRRWSGVERNSFEMKIVENPTKLKS